MSENEPLDERTHELYLDKILDALTDILTEIKKLRGDVQELTVTIERQ